MIALTKEVVYGWGEFFRRTRLVKKNVLKPKCFGKNKNQTPKHTLYLSYNTPLVDIR